MGNQTVSAAKNFDDTSVAGLANGEDITVDTGAKLTIDSDNRWSYNAAVIGAMTIATASGGEIEINGTDVWWIPYDAGAAVNVTALKAKDNTPDEIYGATSGAHGEILGWFSGLGVAPTAAASAIPATGFLKLRSKTGTFQDNENLNLNGTGGTNYAVVNSTTGGQRGWLNIVGEEATLITVPRLGTLDINGDWFYLENCDASTSQVIELPVADNLPGLFIETTTDDVYEFYPALPPQLFNTTYMQSSTTDKRCKFVGNSQNIAYARADDGGSFTNEDAAAINNTTNDMTLTPATPAVDDAYYFGHDIPFSRLWLDLTTAGAGTWTITWEYYSGAAWSTLTTITNDVSNFRTAAAWQQVYFAKPANWTTVAVNGVTCYWIRARVSAYTSITTQPKARRAMISGIPRMLLAGEGSNAIGFKPTSGRKIRIPNLIFSGALTANWAANLCSTTIGDRWETLTTSAGVVSIDKMTGCSFYLNVSQAKTLEVSDSAFLTGILINEVHSQVSLQRVNIGLVDAASQAALTVTSSFGGADLDDCKFTRYGNSASGNYAVTLTDVIDWTIDDCIGQAVMPRGNATTGGWYAYKAIRLTMNDCVTMGGKVLMSACFNSTINDLVYCERFDAVTGTGTGQYAVEVGTKSQYILIDGISFFDSMSNVNPYAGLVYMTYCDYIRVRNIGSTSAILDLQASNGSNYAVNMGEACSNIKLQRIYVSNTRTGVVLNLNSDTTVLMENVWGDAADAIGMPALNMIVKGCFGGGNNQTFTGITVAFTSVYGTIFYDSFHSTTSGKIGLFFNETTTLVGYPSFSNLAYTVEVGTPVFSSDGGLRMRTLNDEVIYTWPYYVKGYSGFQNVAPQLSGTNTGKITYQYKIDKNDGTGFSANWATLDAATLYAEANISPTNGFKLQIRLVCNSTDATNVLTGVYVLGTTTDAYSKAAVYDLDVTETTISITSIVDGSRYRIENASTNALLYEGTVTGATSLSIPYTHNGSDLGVRVKLRKSSAVPKYLEYIALGTITTNGLSIVASQVADGIA